jgi:isocitrate dehydrogenase
MVHWNGSDAGELANKVISGLTTNFTLKMISNRGTAVWPNSLHETFCTDHWRLRFTGNDANTSIPKNQVLSLLEMLDRSGIDYVKTEHLYTFDGKPGYSMGQGQ